MKKECWICKDLTIKTNLCDCDNDFSYCHSDCLNKWVICSSNYKCNFCDGNFKIKKKVKFNLFLKYLLGIFKGLFNAFILLSEYNIYTGALWEEEFN